MGIKLKRSDRDDTTTTVTISVCERHPNSLIGSKLVAINNLVLQAPAMIEDADIAKCPEADYLQVTVWSDKGMVELRVNYHPSNSITITIQE